MKAIVIGKFYPPHKGHHYLINTAVAQADSVEVLVVDNPNYSIPSSQRKKWLQQSHPNTKITIIPDIQKDDDSKAWAEHTLSFLKYTPDLVFSSENYGVTWAQYMGCKHIMVDIERKRIPISATKIRSSITDYWDYLSPAVKKDLAIRITVIGAESTGTTTLTNALATRLMTPYVPEMGRYYTESLAASDHNWEIDDFHEIGHMQNRYETAMALNSNGIIICDTNSRTTELWQRRYTGITTDEMRKIGSQSKTDVYIITGDEIPFVQDGTRDGEHLRATMHKWCVAQAKASNTPYVIVRGEHEPRVDKAIAFINTHLEQLNTIKSH